jgi:adenine-specific DNA-methyltransferase
VDGKSLDLKQQQLERLKELFPEAVAEGKVDWEKLRLTLGDDITIANERYVLNWAGKTDAFKAIQTPTTATLKPQRDQSVNFDTTDNIFIEGENLEVLKALQKSYPGKVKMIYIDPPYNTGNDSFIYPDKFSESKEEYLKRIGDKDEAGYLTKEGFFRKNSKENGQYHSNWLSMMYPRLFLARNLLRDDGVIFVSIDDNEVHNLRLMMNEIFGEENFVAEIIWEKRFTRSNNSKMFASLTEKVLLYRKSIVLSEIKEPRSEKADSIYNNPDDDPRGLWTSVSYVNPATKTQRPNLVYPIKNPFTGKIVEHPTNAWKYEKAKYEEHVRDNRLYWGKNEENTYPRLKKFLSELEGGMVPVDLWTHEQTGTTDEGSKELSELLEIKAFDFPKPSRLVKRMLSIASEKDESGIVLDFFAGSGTTAQGVLELNKEDGGNRKFILVQLPEKTEEDSEAYKAGFKTIAEICKERMRRVIKKLKGEIEKEKNLFEGKKVDLGFKVFSLEPSNFKIWRTDVIETEEELKRQMNVFVDPVRSRSETDAPDSVGVGMAWEILLKSGYELTTKLEKKEIGGVPVYEIAGGEVLLALEKITQKAIDAVVKLKSDSAKGQAPADKPKKFICLDRLFASNDQLKTNTALQMKDAGVEFKTI